MPRHTYFLRLLAQLRRLVPYFHRQRVIRDDYELRCITRIDAAGNVMRIQVHTRHSQHPLHHPPLDQSPPPPAMVVEMAQTSSHRLKGRVGACDLVSHSRTEMGLALG